jgi:dynein heavy chain
MSRFDCIHVLVLQAILQDLFPGVEIPDHDYGRLREEIVDVIENRKLQVIDAQVKKIIQFYETMEVRHGVMLVGPTGGGKTTAYRVCLCTDNDAFSQ